MEEDAAHPRLFHHQLAGVQGQARLGGGHHLPRGQGGQAREELLGVRLRGTQQLLVVVVVGVVVMEVVVVVVVVVEEVEVVGVLVEMRST